ARDKEMPMKCGVFTRSRFAALRQDRALRLPVVRVFAGSMTSPSAHLPRQKKLYTGSLRGRVDGPAEAQNARISANRFAPAARSATARGASRRRRARHFRFRFGSQGERAASFSAHATLSERARGGAQRCAQSPIRFFRRSLTACGLALPPEAFITWPTNQPIAFGFVLAAPTLSGFLPMMSSTSFSIAEKSVTCFNPLVSTIARGSPPSFQTI